MTQSIVFSYYPESCFQESGDSKLQRDVVPFGVRRQLFEKEYPPALHSSEWGNFLNEFEEYQKFCGGWHRGNRTKMRKPLILWIFDLVNRVEERCTKFRDGWALSWEFRYYIHRSETDEAIRLSIPAWFVTIKDPEGNNVHRNWTVMLDQEGDLWIKRGAATSKSPMAFNSYMYWDNAEGRLLDAIYSHMRLREFSIKKQK